MGLYCSVWGIQGLNQEMFQLIEYGNFDHLQINDNHLNIFQYLSLDVVCAYLVIALLSLLIMIKTMRI